MNLIMCECSFNINHECFENLNQINTKRNHTYGYIIKDILKALIVYISIAIKHHVVKISKKAVTIILVK